MSTLAPSPVVRMLIGAVVVAAVVVGVAAVLQIDWSGEGGSGLSDVFKYDLQKYQKTDPALIRYRQIAEIPVEMRQPRAIAVGLDDQILVAGDKSIQVFSPPQSGDGQRNNSPLPLGQGQGVRAADIVAGPKLKEIALETEPYSLAIGNAEHIFPGRIYVGVWDHVEVYGADGSRVATWPTLGIITSLAATESEIFVADARAKVVWRFDTNGKQLGQIDRRAESTDSPGFVVPSPYFAVAMSPDGLLRVVNPGAHRVEAYTLDGHLELSWGRATERIEGFCGCCNPSYIAILPDGRIVTSEKGIPRVKVYSPTGEFEGVVVGPETLAPNPSAAVETREEHLLHPAPVALDSRGHILVLDPAAHCVRVFVENEQ